MKPGVVLSSRVRHLEKWILRHISAVAGPILDEIGQPGAK